MFGYPTVQLWQGNKSYVTVPIHRLVAEAFLPNPSGLPQVDHKNGDKLDYSPDNLEWVTGEENLSRSWKNGKRLILRGQDAGNSRLSEAQVTCIRAFRGLWRQRQMAKHFGVSQHTIMSIQIGRIWQHLPGAQAALKQRKLSDDDVREIRRRGKEETQRVLASRFGVDPSTISQILNGKRHRGYAQS